MNSAGTGVRNHSRPTALIYPNARLLDYRYGAGGLNDSISRLEDLAEGGQAREALTYLGLGTVVEQTRPEPGVNRTSLLSGSMDGGNQYLGLDRFGRVAEQRWDQAGTPLDRFGYGYDRNSNRQNRLDATFSELYHAGGGYDPFDQLTAFARGQLNPSQDGIVSGTQRRSQSWNLDGLGNWSPLTTDSVAQARTHNRQNQIEMLGGVPLDYDHNGNTTQGEPGKTYAYDAWNRLVRVTSGATVVSYGIDAAGPARLGDQGRRPQHHAAGVVLLGGLADSGGAGRRRAGGGAERLEPGVRGRFGLARPGGPAPLRAAGRQRQRDGDHGRGGHRAGAVRVRPVRGGDGAECGLAGLAEPVHLGVPAPGPAL